MTTPLKTTVSACLLSLVPCIVSACGESDQSDNTTQMIDDASVGAEASETETQTNEAANRVPLKSLQLIIVVTHPILKQDRRAIADLKKSMGKLDVEYQVTARDTAAAKEVVQLFNDQELESTSLPESWGEHAGTIAVMLGENKRRRAKGNGRRKRFTHVLFARSGEEPGHMRLRMSTNVHSQRPWSKRRRAGAIAIDTFASELFALSESAL